jgi:hypothetical protein
MKKNKNNIEETEVIDTFTNLPTLEERQAYWRSTELKRKALAKDRQYEDIVKNVDYGIANGGIKYISEIFEFYEDLSGSTCWGYDHLPFRSQFSYVYVVKKDGTILQYNYDGKKQWWLNGEIYETKEDWFDALSDEAKSKCLFNKDFLNE